MICWITLPNQTLAPISRIAILGVVRYWSSYALGQRLNVRSCETLKGRSFKMTDVSSSRRESTVSPSFQKRKPGNHPGCRVVLLFTHASILCSFACTNPHCAILLAVGVHAAWAERYL